MINKIKQNITQYLGFEVDKLLNQGDFVTIFGGAVRDSIANLDIHDVDVLCLGESMINCDLFLQTQGYILDINAYKNGFSNLYKELKVVHEPHSYIKIFEDKIHKVQLIKPWTHDVKYDMRMSKNEQKVIETLFKQKSLNNKIKKLKNEI